MTAREPKQIALPLSEASPSDSAKRRELEDRFALCREQRGEGWYQFHMERARRLRDLVIRAESLYQVLGRWNLVHQELGVEYTINTLMRLRKLYHETGLVGLIDLRGRPSSAEPDEVRHARAPRGMGRQRVSFLRWMGGKSEMAAAIVRLFPKHYGTYWEPMLGAGSVFLTLAPQRAVLCDLNEELITAWTSVQNEPDTLVRELLALPISRQEYLRMRAIDPSTLPPLQRAVRMIYLNATGFNGLYRVNSRGMFNVPYGGDRRFTVSEETLVRVSQRLKHASLRCGSYLDGLVGVQPGDLVYLDPPYLNPTEQRVTVRYAADQFGLSEHEVLAAKARELAELGCHVFVSHYDHTGIRALYPGAVIHKVKTTNRARGGAAERRMELVFELKPQV
jgi:DNA adenine methylase